MLPLINSRTDLEALRGSAEFALAIRVLHGSMTIRTDTAKYPENYNDPDYDGPEVKPKWKYKKNLSAIEHIGLTEEFIVAEYEALEA